MKEKYFNKKWLFNKRSWNKKQNRNHWRKIRCEKKLRTLKKSMQDYQPPKRQVL